MNYESITTQYDLLAYCERISGARTIAFDTEFVSEDSYQPDLCLIQIDADGQLALIDTKTVDDVTPFWKVLAADGHDTIVHAGREEFHFCRRAVGQRPRRLYDVQIAAGLVGLEYPASLQNLLGKVLGKSVPKGETRTDWRRRPLSSRQIEYALLDSAHLPAMRDGLFEQLEKLGRRAWLDEEMETWQTRLEEAATQHRWRRVAGMSGLSHRQLAIVREVWDWREAQAELRNQHPKRILRDDLIVELARRKTADPKRIRSVRGFQRRGLHAHVRELADCVQRALDVPQDQCPQPVHRDSLPQLTVIGQFLATAVANRCRSLKVSPALTASVQDVRELVAHQLGLRKNADTEPALSRGWRAEVVGQLVDDLLHGRLGIRITDPLSDTPISFEPFD